MKDVLPFLLNDFPSIDWFPSTYFVAVLNIEADDPTVGVATENMSDDPLIPHAFSDMERHVTLLLAEVMLSLNS